MGFNPSATNTSHRWIESSLALDAGRRCSGPMHDYNVHLVKARSSHSSRASFEIAKSELNSSRVEDLATAEASTVERFERLLTCACRSAAHRHRWSRKRESNTGVKLIVKSVNAHMCDLK